MLLPLARSRGFECPRAPVHPGRGGTARPLRFTKRIAYGLARVDRSSAMSTGCSPSRLPTRRRARRPRARRATRAGLDESPSRSMPPGSRPFTRCVAACCFRMPSTSASIQGANLLTEDETQALSALALDALLRDNANDARLVMLFDNLGVESDESHQQLIRVGSCSHRAAGMTSIWGQLLRRPALSPVGCRLLATYQGALAELDELGLPEGKITYAQNRDKVAAVAVAPRDAACQPRRRFLLEHARQRHRGVQAAGRR